MKEIKCRCCGGGDLKEVISLGNSPLANNLLDNKDDYCEKYPLEMMYCQDCHYCQLSYTVPPEKLFNNYLYASSTAKIFRDHFEQAAESYIKQFKLTLDSCVVDIGCNDGIGLVPFKERGIKVIGVDPAANIVEITRSKGIETINSYFDENTAKQILDINGPVDLITASNVFAHSDHIHSITNNVFKILKENGCFVVEVQYLLDTIKDLTFDNIYHEHVSYWSVTSIKNFFNKLNLNVVKVEHINTHGGSIRVYVKKDSAPLDQSVFKFLKEEEQFGLTKYSTYQKFSEQIKNAKKNVLENIKFLKNKYSKLAGYGSPAKATTSLNYYEVDHTFIDFTIDDNKLKNGKYIPGVLIPIKSKIEALKEKPNAIVVLAWNFFEYIKENNKDLKADFYNIKELEKDPKDFLFDKIV